MHESFELPVSFEGRDLEFTSSLQRYGYTHRIHVLIHGEQVLFEPDEEGNYRALLSPEAASNHPGIKPMLLQAIAESIEKILR